MAPVYPLPPLGRYVADFYCASQRLVIEVDGDSHFDRVMRITNLEVMEQFEGVCQRIHDALAR